MNFALPQAVPAPFRDGEWISINYKGKEVKGRVMMSQENGTAMMLAFDAQLGRYTTQMAVYQDEDGQYVDLIEHVPVKLERFQ